MAETLKITAGLKKNQVYEELLPQIEGLLDGESDIIANLANTAAVLALTFGHLWTGFYIRRGDRLVLGPFQGPIACTSIALTPVARGVCGTAAVEQKSIIVHDVDQFPGHIACSSDSRSEIVVPLIANGETQLVLDIDSREFGSFDSIDAAYLERVIALLKERHFGEK